MRRKTIAPRTIIITGANNGIGLALAGALLQMGDQVAALHSGCGSSAIKSSEILFG